MNSPITRQQLQNIKKYVEEDILQHNIERIVTATKERIIAHAFIPRREDQGGISRTTLKIDLSQFRIDFSYKYFEPPTSGNHPLFEMNRNLWKTHMHVIIDKLIDLFPGVSFQTDPLRTYILIDWS